MHSHLLSAALLLAMTSISATAFADGEKAEIETMVAQLSKAWNRGSAETVASFWTEDGNAVSPFGETSRGRENLRKYLEREWKGLLKGTRSEFGVQGVRVVRPDVVFADIEEKVSGIRLGTGRLPPQKVQIAALLFKEEKGWKIAESRAYVRLPAMAAAPQQPQPAHEGE